MKQVFLGKKYRVMNESTFEHEVAAGPYDRNCAYAPAGLKSAETIEINTAEEMTRRERDRIIIRREKKKQKTDS